MDPNISDALLDKIVERVIEKIATAGDDAGFGPETEDYGAGLGAPYVPGPIGDEGGVGMGDEFGDDDELPELGDEGPADHAEPDGDEGVGPEDDGGEEGEPVTDDLEAEGEEDDEEDDDMDEPAAGGKAKKKAGEKYQSHCDADAPPRDAKRSREQYSSQFAAEAKRIRDSVMAETKREISRYSAENKALRDRVNALEAERERTFREQKLTGLLYEGYELNVDEELGRLERYSRDEFENQFTLIRARYRKGDQLDGEFIPVAPGNAPSPQADEPVSREDFLERARYAASAASRESDPEKARAVYLEAYKSARPTVRG